MSPSPTDPHLPDVLPADPFPLFLEWFRQAHTLGPGGAPIQPNPNAFSLATVDPDGRLGNRIVLCKSIDPAAGHIVFHTNYLGRKGRALTTNPRAAACFHWDILDRQVRIEGPVTKSPESESDAYFQTRPWLRRVGAWASQQSEVIPSRADLAARVDETFRRFGLDPANPPPLDAKIDIPRPPHWGGFRLWVERLELWIGGVARLHDRAIWTRELRPEGDGYRSQSTWVGVRLQP
jgi:pyridoxamine 5'-phosphate oxidase